MWNANGQDNSFRNKKQNYIRSSAIENQTSIEQILSELAVLFLSQNKPTSFGNQILYDMCDPNKNPWGDAARLADKIWLIGRSYAASPERRYYRKKNESGADEGRTEPETRGDGTGKYFQETAEILRQDKRYSGLAAGLQALTPLRFDGGAEDIKRLKQGIVCVALFNEMLKNASKQYDQKHNAGIYESLVYRNQVSFGSKFLHFHVPHSIFIIDHFTKEGGCFLCSTRTRKNAGLEDCGVVIDKAVREAINAYCPPFKISVEDIDTEVGDDAKEAVDWYINHCLRSYRFGCFLHDKLDLSPDNAACSFPRMIDSIFQRVKETE